MHSYTVERVEPNSFNSGADYVVKAMVPASVVSLGFTRSADARTDRRPGRSYDLVHLKINGSSMVTRGTCNHMNMIDKMNDLSNATARALQRVADAQAELAAALLALEEM